MGQHRFILPDDPLSWLLFRDRHAGNGPKKFYGDEFVQHLQTTYNPLDVVFRLANETGLVVLNGGGFDGPEWSVRVSLANLNEKDYIKIGLSIRRILNEYAANGNLKRNKKLRTVRR